MREGAAPDKWKIVPLASDPVIVYSSPDSDKVFLEHPSIAALPGGRIVVACDQEGPGVAKLSGPKGREQDSNHWLQGKIFVSKDKGKTGGHEPKFVIFVDDKGSLVGPHDHSEI